MTLAPMEEILANSFRDFHAKGFDYLCLSRDPKLTLKLYFFDGDVAKAPEVVNPHDHRYAFTTVCFNGIVTNIDYFLCEEYTPRSCHYEAFDYLTPLNAGSGFAWRESVWLRELRRCRYPAGDAYVSEHWQTHTIQIQASETIMLLRQYEDVVPVGRPTTCYTQDKEPPPLSGLYSRFTPDAVLRRFAQFERCTGSSVESLFNLKEAA